MRKLLRRVLVMSRLAMTWIEMASIYESRPAARCDLTLELQLKATVNLGEPKDGCFRFPLKRRNYDLLREEAQTPRLLLVLDLPRNEHRWVTITENELVMRHRAYWLNLKGHEETTNQSTITVHLPRANLFDVESLRALMEQSREEKIE